jgi:tetratricopeptide (TPR) repeat protein
VSNRLAETLVNLGVIDWHAQDHARAEQRFRRAEELLLSAAPDAREPAEKIDIDIGQVNVNWGGMLHTLGRHDEAIARADAGLGRLEPYLRIEPNDWEAREMCLKLHGNRALALAQLGRHRESVREWTRVVELAREPVPPDHRIRLAIELVLAGDMAGARTQTQLLNPASKTSAADCYNLACVMALSAAAAGKDTRTLLAERARLVEADISDALRWLESAARSGFFKDPANRDHARNDPDLSVLASRAEFRKLIETSAP